MQRMSEPQIVDAFTRIRPSPCCGDGTDTIRISTELFPGRNAASIVFFIIQSPLLQEWNQFPACRLGTLSWSDFSVQIPQVFPFLPLFPEEDLPLDEAAISVERAYLAPLPTPLTVS